MLVVVAMRRSLSVAVVIGGNVTAPRGVTLRPDMSHCNVPLKNINQVVLDVLVMLDVSNVTVTGKNKK
jgi:hypothetical protein